jgi:hypothetical protein
MNMKIKLTHIVSILAFVIGAMAIVSGGQVLLGKDPGYYVIDWVPVYNFSMGLISFFLSAILIWKDHKYALPVSIATLISHSVVMLILQIAFNDVVATESIRAMTIRIIVWTVNVALLLFHSWKARSTQVKMVAEQP